MPEMHETLTPQDDEEALKRRLLNRIAIAGVVVVALLGGLAVFDAFYVPPKHPPAVAKAPAAPPQAPVEEPKPAEAKDVAKAEPQEELPPAPEVSAQPNIPLKPPRPLTPPATARPAMVKPSEPMLPVPARPAAPRELARAAPPATSPGPLSKPLSQAVQATRQYVVQVGVFNNVANAEELRAKLELAGIPVQIEARVQVGPFKSREEAAAAREKLQALGMEPGILTAIRR